jgi:hypothetical protein
MKNLLFVFVALAITFTCQAQEKFSKSGKSQDEAMCGGLGPELRGFNDKCKNTPITTTGFEYQFAITFWDYYQEDPQQKKALDEWEKAYESMQSSKPTGRQITEFQKKYGAKPRLSAKCDKSIPNQFVFLKKLGLAHEVFGYRPQPGQDPSLAVNCELKVISKEAKIFCSNEFKNMFNSTYLIGGRNNTDGVFQNGSVTKYEIKSTGKKYPVRDEIFVSSNGSSRYDDVNFFKEVCPKL